MTATADNDAAAPTITHAALARTTQAARDPATGEVRVPLTLWSFDRQIRTVDLVLTADEAELHAVWLANAVYPPTGEDGPGDGI